MKKVNSYANDFSELSLRHVLKVFVLLAVVNLAFFGPSHIIAEPLLKRSTSSGQANNTQSQEQETQALQEELNQLRFDFFKFKELMQNNLQRLQGTIEEQNYLIEQFQRSERARYSDLDQRLNDVKTQLTTSQLSIAPESATSSTLSEEDEKTYKGAIKKIESKDFENAIVDLLLYLEFFPEGKFLPQAHYWLGELYLVIAIPEYETAKSHFEAVITKFPKHAKVPDSLFKLGLTYLALENKKLAKNSFEKVLVNHASSSVAQLAQEQLELLK